MMRVLPSFLLLCLWCVPSVCFVSRTAPTSPRPVSNPGTFTSLGLADGSSTQPQPPKQKQKQKQKQTLESSYDVVIVGSGIGGLSAAAMLSKYGYTVLVLESHSETGGCAHGFTLRGPDNEGKNSGIYKFDTGPSFFSGLNPNIPPKSSNPLRTILDYVGESVDCIPYETFGLVFPEGEFVHTTGFGGMEGVVGKLSGTNGVEQWSNLMEKMEPLAEAVSAMPTVALRTDIGAALTAGPFLPKFGRLGNPFAALKLTKPFSSILKDAGVNDAFTQNWLDLLCFCLSGMPSSGTITAEMAMMMGEFYEPGAVMDCPVGGARSIVDALARGVTKHGGVIATNSHVKGINVENGKATGVTLTNNNRVINAKQAVISNLSIWDLLSSGIVDRTHFPDDFYTKGMDTPPGKSFLHIHLGFRATTEELSKLQAHYMYVDDWSRGVDADENTALLSIPSVHDDTLAPDGHAVLHIYTPATEDFQKWEHLDRRSEEYQALKVERSQFLWKVLTKTIPDIKERVTIQKIGTPLTHARFLRRYRGSYGPAIKAGEASFPFPGTPIQQLLTCGDSCFPGIGVPAVAGSGILAAHSVSLDSIKPQLKLLESLK